jgi:hypothetical protein
MPNTESSKYALERAYLQSIVLFCLIESAHDVLFIQNAVSLHIPTTAYTIAIDSTYIFFRGAHHVILPHVFTNTHFKDPPTFHLSDTVTTYSLEEFLCTLLFV